ncbi:hypothetical protein Tco_0528782 [Tanacetum coccineum]
MPFPRFTKSIINHFLKQHKSLSNLKYQHYHTIKDDGIVSQLNFVKIGEDYQEYGLAIPEVMLNDSIRQPKSYQMFIKYSTESKPEPEPVKRKTASRRVVKKKVTISANDNIISIDPDVALKLGNSISKTKAKEAKAARQVHATHARIVTESVLEPTRRRKSGKVTSDPPKNSRRQPGTRGSSEGTGTIPGVPDESTVISTTLSKETGTKLGVLNEEKDITKENKDDKDDDADDEGNYYISDNQDVDDEDAETESDEDEIYKYMIRVRKDEDVEMSNAEVEYSDKGDEEVTDAVKADAEKTSEVKDDAKKTELPPTSSSLSVSSGFGDQFLKLSSDSSLVSTVKGTTIVEINSLLEVKIQSEVPHNQSTFMLSVPVSVISEPLVLTTVRESPSITIVTTLHPPPVSTTPPVPQQITTLIPTPTITTDAPTITTTISESNALSAVQLRVAKLEKDVSELKKIDLFTEALAALKTQVPSFVDKYLGSKVGDTPTVYLEQESEKTPSEILKIKKEQAEKQKMPKFTIKYTYKASLKEYDQKSTLYQTMHANKSFNKNPTNHRLYHALMEALIEDENAIDKGVADIVQDHKRKHDDDEDDDDEDPPVRPNQDKKTKRRRTKDSESSKKPSTTKETPKGKAPSKGSKTGKSAPTKEPVEEPIVEVVMDDADDDVVHDDEQPQDASEPKTTKTPNLDWFTQPPRPPTPDPE